MTIPTNGQTFEDILDGYFPFGESLRQCLGRQHARVALVVLTHAPVLHLPDRPGTAPVPLRMGTQHSGLIQRLLCFVHMDATGGVEINGAGEWYWHDGTMDRPLNTSTRLAEPAFLRGIALSNDTSEPAPQTWLLQVPGEIKRLWGFNRALSGICRLQSDQSPDIYCDETRRPPDAPQPLVVTIDTPNVTTHSQQMARDWCL